MDSLPGTHIFVTEVGYLSGTFSHDSGLVVGLLSSAIPPFSQIQWAASRQSDILAACCSLPRGRWNVTAESNQDRADYNMGP